MLITPNRKRALHCHCASLSLGVLSSAIYWKGGLVWLLLSPNSFFPQILLFFSPMSLNSPLQAFLHFPILLPSISGRLKFCYLLQRWPGVASPIFSQLLLPKFSFFFPPICPLIPFASLPTFSLAVMTVFPVVNVHLASTAEVYHTSTGRGEYII